MCRETALEVYHPRRSEDIPFLIENEKNKKVANVGPAGVRTHHFLHSSRPIRNQLVGGQISRGKAQHLMKQKKTSIQT